MNAHWVYLLEIKILLYYHYYYYWGDKISSSYHNMLHVLALKGLRGITSMLVFNFV